MATEVMDNTAKQRFELTEDSHTAFADYRRDGTRLYIRHVEAPEALQGKGTAGRLMAGIVEHARAGNAKIVPQCSYARAWLQRHPEHGDLVTTG